MKKAVQLIPAFFLAVTAGTSHAYYLKNAIPGKVTVAVEGACAIPSASTGAYLADIHDDSEQHVLIGHGLVTVAGELLALEENRLDIRSRQDYVSGAKLAEEYVDLAGDTLRAFLTQAGVRCDIARLEPDVDSKAAYTWNSAGGSVRLRAGFGGYEQSRCSDGGDIESCKSRKIKGVIQFKGSWQSAP